MKFVLGLLLAFSCFANAYEVYPGCSQPTAATGPSYYLDPVNGKLTNDGLTPKTALPGLDKVFAAGLIGIHTYYIKGGYPATGPKPAYAAMSKTAKIMEGSTLLLMNGYHGDTPFVMGNMEKWTRITAAPGQSPTVGSISFGGGKNWIIDGLHFKRTQVNAVTPARPYSAMLSISNGGFFGPTSDFVVTGNTFEGDQVDPYTTSQADWKKLNIGAIYSRAMPCLSITNNTMQKVTTGVSFIATSLTEDVAKASNLDDTRFILVKGNTIKYFTVDGIEYSGFHVMIDSNTITDSIETLNGLHYDGMQGQGNFRGEGQQNADVQISNNIVRRHTDTKVLYPAYMQGIDTFDGVWDNVRITNNYIETGHWHCISFYGTSDLTIDHNTCALDPNPTVSASGTIANQPWMGASGGKAGSTAVPTNLTFTNNVGFQYFGMPSPKTTNNSGNVFYWTLQSINPDFTVTTQTKPGTYPTNNVLDRTVKVDPATMLASGVGQTKGYQPWVKCAAENGVCSFTGTHQVEYGANGHFIIKTLTGGTPCTNAVFTDPLKFTVKACYVK